MSFCWNYWKVLQCRIISLLFLFYLTVGALLLSDSIFHLALCSLLVSDKMRWCFHVLHLSLNDTVYYIHVLCSTPSSAKPISMMERCWCRSTVNTVPQRNIRELKFLHTPNCPFQVMWVPPQHRHVWTRSHNKLSESHCKIDISPNVNIWSCTKRQNLKCLLIPQCLSLGLNTWPLNPASAHLPPTTP